MDQWDEIEPRDKPIHVQSINLQQKSQEYTMGKGLSLQSRCWENWTATCKKNKNGSLSLHYMQKLIKNELKIWTLRPETIKLLEENTGTKLLDTSQWQFFKNLAPKGKVTKAKIKK